MGEEGETSYIIKTKIIGSKIKSVTAALKCLELCDSDCIATEYIYILHIDE